jgi:hypothetical protein
MTVQPRAERQHRDRPGARKHRPLDLTEPAAGDRDRQQEAEAEDDRRSADPCEQPPAEQVLELGAGAAGGGGVGRLPGAGTASSVTSVPGRRLGLGSDRCAAGTHDACCAATQRGALPASPSSAVVLASSASSHSSIVTCLTSSLLTDGRQDITLSTVGQQGMLG